MIWSAVFLLCDVTSSLCVAHGFAGPSPEPDAIPYTSTEGRHHV